MKYQLFKWILVFGIVSTSYSVVCAEESNLIYDGKNYFESNHAIHLFRDRQQIECDEMTVIEVNDDILVAVNGVFPNLGANVEWNASEQSLYIHNSNNLIILEINSNIAWVNGENKQLDIPATLINDQVMIPLRFVGKELGYHVEWSKADSSIYIETKEDAKSQNENNINNEVVNFLDSEYLSYLGQDHTIILKHLVGLQASEITYKENYHQNQIIIDLNSDYSAYLKAGVYPLSLEGVKQIEVIHQLNETQLIVTTSKIQALKIEEQDGNILLKVVKPSEKYSKIIVIDAGHGAHDPGTTYGEIKEKDLNLAISNEVVSVLKSDPNIQVYATREDDTFFELQERVEFSNQIEPDLFISIHINSVSGNASASGTETYYTLSTDTRNKTFATMVQEALVKEFGTRNRGIKANNLYVTKYTDAPAILIEIGFLDNESDRTMMTSQGFENKCALTIYQCILDYYAKGLND